MKIRLGLVVALLCGASRVGVAGPNEDLIGACRRGDLDAVNAALAAGANVNALDPQGSTAIAAAFFWPEITKVLLAKGADPNLGAAKALFNASLFYSTETQKLLLDAGADPNKPHLVHPAAIFVPLIAAERKKGAAANQATIAAWESAMQRLKPTEQYVLPAAIGGTQCNPCIEALLAKGARVDLGVAAGKSLLHVLADGMLMTPELWKKNFAQTKANIEAFGVKLPPWYSETLPADRIGPATQVVKLLVQKGADINAKATTGMGPMTPLEIALNAGLGARRDVMLALIENGADVKLVSKQYGPLILQAAQTGFADVVKAMVDKGADINTEGNAFTDSGKTLAATTFTPLTAAAMKNRTEVVRYLLGAGGTSRSGVSGTIVVGGSGCPADLKNKSAIYFAIDHDNLEMTKLIVEHKAFDGRPLSVSAQKMTNCIGVGMYTPQGYAKALRTSKELIDYLGSVGL